MNKKIFISFSKKTVFGKREVHKIVGYLLNELDLEIESLEINFVSKDEIHNLNKQFLKHDYSTDIITFDYSQNKQILDGELFISVDDAKEYSFQYKVTLEEELTRLIIHGILHLAGYDDQTPKEKSKMKRIENKLTENYKFKK